MSLYLSEDFLKLACRGFKKLSSTEEVRQGVTQDVSAIRHCFALDRLLKKNSIISAKLQHRSDLYLQEYITFVGDIVRLDDKENYTTNLINDIKNKHDFGVGSNLISAGVATHSVQSQQNYPKKADKGLILIDNYNFSLLPDYLDKLISRYDLSRVGFSFLIWLNRFTKFDVEDNTPKGLFEKLKRLIKDQYSDGLAEIISYSTFEDFEKFSSQVKDTLSDREPDLISCFDEAGEQSTKNSIKKLSTTSLLPKPFLLLAGISGTGKTRFVREQAKASGQFDETYCLTSVRPDWHEPSDLLGYVSRLSSSGQAEYVTTDVLQFIAKAWRGIADSGLTISEQSIESIGERLVVSGDRAALDAVLPYWLCLDEMNLAPVEQYFADYLSVLETREWHWQNDDFTYGCDALLKSITIKEVANTNTLRKNLGFEQPEYDELWQLICKHGLSIPFNLIVAGTVNMDETTHGFSRKVIDRALSFDFGNFFPNNYDEFFTSPNINKSLSYPRWSQATKDDLSNTVDSDGSKTVAFLTSVNAVLKNTPFELAYRALNELLLSVISSQPQDELTLQTVWDDFMMCKVLPRIEGDSDKLFVAGISGAEDATLLQHLETVLQQELSLIWNETEGSSNARPDFYRERKVADAQIDKEPGPDADKIIRINCRTKDKLNWMTQRLEVSTFTSFWP